MTKEEQAYQYPDQYDAITMDLIGATEPYQGYWHKSEEGMIKSMLKMIDNMSLKERLYDAGCGYGRLTLRFSSYFQEIYAAEPDKERHDICKQNLLKWKLDHKVTLIQAGAEDLAKENFFDAILCSHVIQHLPEQHVHSILKAFHRMLKEDGALFLTTSHSVSGTVQYTKSYLNKDKKRVEEGIDPISFNMLNNEKGILPVKFYTYEEITSLLHKCNFEVIDYKVYHHTRGNKQFDSMFGIDRFINLSRKRKEVYGRDLYVCAVPR